MGQVESIKGSKINIIPDILSLVEKPSQYLGTEYNHIKKDLQGIKLQLALAFPDLYEIGTSHFGLTILYHILNQNPVVSAERVFAPGLDYEKHLRKYGLELCTLESQRTLHSFDIIGFSLLYELNFTNVLTMLDIAGIPLKACQRNHDFPIIIAGGPCTCNPEPMADFFDAMVVGDGEIVIQELVQQWILWKEADQDKDELLKLWSGIRGVYIPSFYQPIYHLDHQSQIIQTPVDRAILPDLSHDYFPLNPIVAFGKPIHDRLRLELARGCTRGCRFCQAGMLYRPVRERTPAILLEQAAAGIAATGYNDISLLSLSTGDYTCLSPFLENLMSWCQPRNIAVSFPSLRVGSLTPGLMQLIKKVRKTGFTLAPEAGSQRLRDVINKGINEDEIIKNVTDAFQLGWRTLKLYFMIGLPTETQDDIQAIIELVKKLRIQNKRGQINVSVATFIPKAHTPFQWEAQLPLHDAKNILQNLKQQLKLSRIRFKWQDPEVSQLEGLFARGDRRLSHALITAFQNGCRLDGWSDHFKPDIWQAALEQNKIDLKVYNQSRDQARPQPWDHINVGVSREFLLKEYARSLKAEHTSDCRTGDCHQCGVCDFDQIKPQIKSEMPPDLKNKTRTTLKQNPHKLEISFSKTGPAKFFGHLEMVNIFIRAFQRARIQLKFSQGFHPLPRISFSDTLPIGMESLAEKVYVSVLGTQSPAKIKDLLNPQLPQGLTILKACLYFKTRKKSGLMINTYKIKLPEEIVLDLSKLNQQNPCMIIHKTKKAITKINLYDFLIHWEPVAKNELILKIKVIQGRTIRPGKILKQVFHFDNLLISRTQIIKEACSIN